MTATNQPPTRDHRVRSRVPTKNSVAGWFSRWGGSAPAPPSCMRSSLHRPGDNRRRLNSVPETRSSRLRAPHELDFSCASLRWRSASVPDLLCRLWGRSLDPSLVCRFESLSLLLRILAWDGADEVVAPAVLVDLAQVPLDDDLVHLHRAPTVR